MADGYRTDGFVGDTHRHRAHGIVDYVMNSYDGAGPLAGSMMRCYWGVLHRERHGCFVWGG